MGSDLFISAKYPPILSSSNAYEPPAEPFAIAEIFGLHIFGQQANLKLQSHSNIEERSFGFYSIVHVVDGSAWYWSEQGGRKPVQKSQLLIIPPDTEHDFAASKDGAVIDLLCITGPTAITMVSSGILVAGISDFGQARQLLPVIETSLKQDCGLQVKSAVDLLNILTNHRFSAKSRGIECSSKIGPLISLMKSNPECWWDSSQMAEFCNVSEVQLRRLFKKETGYSPKVYLDKVKVEHAAELLKKNFSVGIVSDLLGYSDQFHFSRRFKSIMGLSPRDFLSKH